MALSIPLCNKSQFNSNIELIPSTKIYYDNYPYKVDIKGPGYPHPNYDPHLHYEISDFMKTCGMFWKRERNVRAGRSIYLGSYDDVLWLTNWMCEHISAVHGPVSDEHMSCLFTPGLVLREKLFYNEFDCRIEFFTGGIRGPKMSSDEQNTLKSFVEQNFEKHRWSTTYFNWYYNYLYCTQDEYNELEGFLNLSYKRWITYKEKVVLFSEL